MPSGMNRRAAAFTAALALDWSPGLLMGVCLS